MKRIRVLIVDDCQAMRLGLRAMLANEPRIEVCGEAASAFAAMGLTAALRPGVVLLDVCMPYSNATRVAGLLRERYASTKVVFLISQRPDFGAVEIPLGGDAYLVKNTTPEKLVETVFAVNEGKTSMDPDCVKVFLDQYTAALRQLIQRTMGLSEQEVELLQNLAAGASNTEIAETMYMSEATVTRKIQHVIEKLGVANRTQAAAEAIRKGVI